MGRLTEAAYQSLNVAGLPALVRGLRGAAPIFCFHDVVPDERAGRIGDGPLHLGVSWFAEFAAWVTGAFRCVTLAELGERLRGGRGVRGLAAVTFDDGYRGVFSRALPLLEAAGARATLFIVGSGPGRAAPFWWDRGAGAGKSRDELLWTLQGDEARIAPAASAGADPDLLMEPWDGIARASAGGHEIGWHTTTHRNVAALDEAEARREIAAGRETLAAHGLPLPRSFAFPYGLADGQSARLVEESGYVAGVTLAFGPAPSGWPAAALPRINVPAGLPHAALHAWAGGLRFGPGPVRLDRREFRAAVPAR